MSIDNESVEIKLAVLGKTLVGKSALTYRYISNKFPTEHDTTIEDQYKVNNNIDGINCKIEVLDTAGQDDYQSMLDTWIGFVEGFLLVYAINDIDSYEELKEKYNRIIKMKNGEIFSVIIVGFISIILVFPYENEDKNEELINENIDNIQYKILPNDSTNSSKIEDDNSLKNISNTEINNKEKDDYPSLKECLLSKEFLICILTVGCTLLFGFLLSNTYRTFGKIMKIKEQYLQTLSKCYTLINTFSRILWGIIMDKFNFTIPYFIICINQIICSGFFYWSVFKVETYFLVCCFGVLSFAGHVTIFPNVINKKFGIENSVTLLGICGLFSGFTCLLGPILTKSIIVTNDDYMIIYLIGSFTSFIYSVLTWFIKY